MSAGRLSKLSGFQLSVTDGHRQSTVKLGDLKGPSIGLGAVVSIACLKITLDYLPEIVLLPGIERGANALSVRQHLSERLMLLLTDMGLDNSVGL